MIDTTHYIVDPWIKEITKNQADYTISNLCVKDYTVFQGTDEDYIIKAASKDFDYACVFSTGTEFLNGSTCLVELEKECNDNFLIKGHILDRGDAYYELHQQCYLINLKEYRNLNYPIIGNQLLGEKHDQFFPKRSEENLHDEYTPLWITAGDTLKTYYHKCHGWNIISIALKKFSITAFTHSIRKNKKHLYPESSKDFYKNLSYVYFKERFCATEFVHTEHTETSNKFVPNLRQIVAPASGEWYKSMFDPKKECKVILYDYNLKSLEYWKNNVKPFPNVSYEFIHWDLMGNFYDITPHLDLTLEKHTLINLSNIFCYEGTSTLANTRFRLEKENELLRHLKNKLPEAWINFSARTNTGFINETVLIQKLKDISIYKIQDFKAPTWRISEW